MIKYKSGYKYQLAENYRVQIPIIGRTISQGPIKLTTQGWLTIRKGYAWDGPTWAIDTKNFMRASLIHDALYQLIREKRLAPSQRELADKILWVMCIEDGMWRIRAELVYFFVSRFGGPAASPKNTRALLTAP
jgi:hypothetical protein